MVLSLNKRGLNSLPHNPDFLYPEEGRGKHCGKRRKCWQPAFSPFPTVFSTLSQRVIVIFATFNLSSANCFQFGHIQILSFGKELMHLHDVSYQATRIYGPIKSISSTNQMKNDVERSFNMQKI